MSFLIPLFRRCAAAVTEFVRATLPQAQRVPVRIAPARKAQRK